MLSLHVALLTPCHVLASSIDVQLVRFSYTACCMHSNTIAIYARAALLLFANMTEAWQIMQARSVIKDLVAQHKSAMMFTLSTVGGQEKVDMPAIEANFPLLKTFFNKFKAYVT